jgi:signal transduction histidine kinase
VFDGDLGAIFDPFFRSGPGQASTGYGLGLAITRRVIEAHGGHVAAANRPGGGLLVTLELPAAG